jgi:hypothetical protein
LYRLRNRDLETLACAMLPLPVTDIDLAGEGRKKVCPDTYQ